ncbi:hypothetical protein FN846DRAFT_773871 [Sphaerosporella brunnea]|uniref:Cytochrome b5 heme-binding domain-containing protein n=1 Tax=Sphaerosporella brunnea TaxID=1250544 RepID=A0A5J5F5D3_9PEZI|nr:hypothetical protein FN846DRAFT_773839 [Sphaerosporella brunnea]KAA8911627.1 hypothetical protein FN846DRAFT_773871 [Sphaerosporella brunnea]
MSEISDVRQRKPLPLPDEPSPSKKKTKNEDDDANLIDNPRFGISILDVLRVLSGLLLLSCIFSWLITDGTSLTWGYRPRISRWRTLKAFFQPAVNLTDAELALYDGTDPTRPIYVAINGSVFDVSANPAMYGPGGGYHFFAGRDAARAYVSGCFAEDLTWDLRGLEEMYITGRGREEDEAELAEISQLRGREGMDGRIRWLQSRRDKRRKEAWQKVAKQVDHWDRFFRAHERYFYVGRVVHESLDGKPVRELCKKGGKRKPSSSK